MPIGVLRESEPTVLARDLDAEGPEIAQPLDDLGRDPGVALDLLAVHLLAQEAGEPVHEIAGATLLFGIRFGMRVDEIQLEAAQEQLAHE